MSNKSFTLIHVVIFLLCLFRLQQLQRERPCEGGNETGVGVAEWGEGKGWVATEGQSLVWGKGRGAGSWGLREEILRNPGPCLKEEREGRCNGS